ncbi:vacuolar membrane-associated protein iml1 [Physocladia obscura]|uniref:Vacuolar membrane-associated protein IML1 n=1 Tax=Physocladia obscura TaxID=109957 RepID=A0AAD5TG10_9FUNG|nr:vacuolar membrane-associated protein iml1 [Physocladia obscura]
MECILGSHDSNFSEEDLVVSAEALLSVVGEVAIGDLLEIEAMPTNAKDSDSSKTEMGEKGDYRMKQNRYPLPLIVQVTWFAADTGIRQLRERVSVAQRLVAQHDFQPHSLVTIRRIDPEPLRAELVVLAFAYQYVTRSDMWRLKLSLRNTLVYAGKPVNSTSIRSFVAEMVVGGQYADCAYVTDSTKLVFRSHTAKMFIFIQMSKEMWEFGDDGQLLSEKCITGFLPDLFSVWKEASTNHVVSVVLFSRIFYKEQSNHTESISNTNSESVSSFENLSQLPYNEMFSGILRDYLGRPYRDFYRVVADWEIRSDWSQILVPLKREFVRFERDVLQSEIGGYILSGGYNSSALDGNFLESVNLAMNQFAKHYIDRDLVKTGLSIIVVTPSPGFFNVNKKLLRLTTQRMFDCGVACDIVSLANRPLHMVPLFQYVGQKVRTKSTAKNEGSVGASGSQASGISGINGPTSHFPTPLTEDNSLQGGKIVNTFEEVVDPLWIDDDIDRLKNENEWSIFFNLPNWCDVSFYNETENGFNSKQKTGFKLRTQLPEAHSISTKLIPCIVVDYFEDENAEISKTNSNDDDSHDTITTGINTVSATISIGSILSDAYSSNNSVYDQYDQQVFNPHDVLSNQDHFEMPQIFDKSPEYSEFSYQNRDDNNSSNSYISSDQSVFEKTSLGGLEKNPRRSSILSQRSANLSNISFKNAAPIAVYTNELSLTYDTLKAKQNDENSHFSDGTWEPVEAAGIKIANYMSNSRHNHQKHGVDGSTTAVSWKTGSGFADLIDPAKQSPGKRSILIKNTSKKTPNPCNPMKSKDEFGPALNKWEHIFPESQKRYFNTGVNWTSMSTPACLPLSHGFYPSEEILGTYSKYIYGVIPDETSLYQDQSGPTVTSTQRLESLFVELISQRLTQGFQIITAPITEKGVSVTMGDEIPVADVVGPGTVSKFWKPEHLPTTTKTLKSAPVPSSTRARLSSINSKSSPLAKNQKSSEAILPISEKDAMKVPLDKPYYLGFGHHIHRLYLDSAGQKVEVRILMKEASYSKDNYNSKCMVWSKNMPGYLNAAFSFSYPHLANYSWNNLDHLIAGSQKEMTDSLRYWRTRFLLIPLESTKAIQNPFAEDANISDEDLRLIGFDRFIDFVEKYRWSGDEKAFYDTAITPTVEYSPALSNGATRLARGSSGLGIEKTTFLKSQFVAVKWQKLKKNAETDGTTNFLDVEPPKMYLTKASSNLNIVLAMSNPTTGLDIQDRVWHHRLYKNHFIGSECVSWMLLNFSDLYSREEAVAFGNELHIKGIIVHGKKLHKFLDGHFYYKISDDCLNEANLREEREKKHSDKDKEGKLFQQNENKENSYNESNYDDDKENQNYQNRDWEKEKEKELEFEREKNGGAKEKLLRKPGSATEVKLAVKTAAQNGEIKTSPTAKKNIPPIELSKKIVIDLDSKNISTRKEMVVLHYDAIHNSHNCYHLYLHWLVCTPRLLEELLDEWNRSAKKNGFKFVEAPIEQARRFSNDNPFQSLIQINLAFSPPPTATLADKTDFIFAVAHKNGFILDLEADKAFHDTGASVKYSYTNQPYYEYTQFVHCTGVAFIQVLPGAKGFLWTNNSLFLASSISNGKGFNNGTDSTTAVDSLRASLVQACTDISGLEKIWLERRNSTP